MSLPVKKNSHKFEKKGIATDAYTYIVLITTVTEYIIIRGGMSA